RARAKLVRDFGKEASVQRLGTPHGLVLWCQRSAHERIFGELSEADGQGVQVAPKLLDGMGDAIEAPPKQILINLIALQVSAQSVGDHCAHRERTRGGVRAELLKEVAG